jgi:hypothetical protein
MSSFYETYYGTADSFRSVPVRKINLDREIISLIKIYTRIQVLNSTPGKYRVPDQFVEEIRFVAEMLQQKNSQF